MRSEAEMYKLFLDIASEDERILAVYMNGSRTNKNVPKDMFQDYDIVFVVTETRSFIEDKDWIRRFGNILYMQYPDESPDCPKDKENLYGWLMQFDDGCRVDLHVESAKHAREHIGDDKLCRVLLDKGNVLPKICEATDEDYHVKRPSEAQFRACSNEFWWCSNNLAKGLWREEMPYVQDMANFIVRKQLEKMLAWKVGILTDFGVSVGKSAKYLYRWLTGEEYQRYLDTYFGGEVEAAWRAVFSMCGLFASVAEQVAEGLGYTYDKEEGKAALAYLRHVRSLPGKGRKKTAVVFPGIGYHRDKPLLYHACRLARERGYEIVSAEYGTLPANVKGNPEKMREAFDLALRHVTEQLADYDFSSCSKVLFLSKSIGTAVAAAYDAQRRIGAGHVYYTPVAESFQAIGKEGIVFHGTADSWAETKVITRESEKRGLALFVTEGADHSMETGDALADLSILGKIMEETDRYIRFFDKK